MRFRDRDDEQQRPRLQDDPDSSGNLEGLRAAGAEFLTASAEILEETLSGDAAGFLRANRQEGGQ
jgi:hypothetical protein